MSWVSEVPHHRQSRLTPAELALSGARAVCGVSLAARHSLLDRLQGGRMLVQAAAELWAGTATPASRPVGERGAVYAVATAVDALHGASMLVLAALPGRRRHAAASAALALLFAAGDLLVVRIERPPAHGQHGPAQVW